MKHGLSIGRLKTRHYMQEMVITVIYPKPNLSKAAMETRFIRIC